jgi:hypothetical protein
VSANPCVNRFRIAHTHRHTDTQTHGDQINAE